MSVSQTIAAIQRIQQYCRNHSNVNHFYEILYIDLKILISFSIILIYKPQHSHCSIMNVLSQRMQEDCEITGCEILCLLLVELYACSSRNSACTSIEWCIANVVSVARWSSTELPFFLNFMPISLMLQNVQLLIIIHVLSYDWHLLVCWRFIHFLLSTAEISVLRLLLLLNAHV